MATSKAKEVIDYRGMRVFLEFGGKAVGDAFFVVGPVRTKQPRRRIRSNLVERATGG